MIRYRAARASRRATLEMSANFVTPHFLFSIVSDLSRARTIRTLLVPGALIAVFLLFATPALAQTRYHLTDPETKLCRFYQELEKRTEVFIKATSRRFPFITRTTFPPPT